VFIEIGKDAHMKCKQFKIFGKQKGMMWGLKKYKNKSEVFWFFGSV
jgi:hypothetical protein